ncbi:hypothetical protein M408DRAFT_333168 [Serendipita vermifera MAFF 305830]|uniref:Peptidase S54 rhomboid domain-containing protein n=1 Tax=Serendipita vermifera MAFF 305830 TaxID=933852 RepID=A0A0C2W6A0_SERVB|nr:hypothetical protein M408DRAFT_333168 [Serendipita vermifera MAFF 305830]
MSFHNGPITKALMIGIGVNTLAAGAFQYKHFFRLQLVPHITKHHQFWRLLSYQLAFPNSSNLFITQIILYNASIALERIFGSRKFGSFVFVSSFVSTCLTVVSMMVATSFGVNTSFSGPISLLFSILYSYSRTVPSAYRYSIMGATFTDKTPMYLLALLMALSTPPESLILSVIGLLAGAACRSDMLPFKAYRLPNWVNQLASKLRPLIGSTEPGFRPVSAVPESGLGSGQAGDAQGTANAGDPSLGTDLTSGVAAPTAATPRTPTQEEIAQLTAMFPAATRAQILNALGSTTSIEAAVERLIQ